MDALAHIRRRLISVLVTDPRGVAFVLMVCSALAVIALMCPGELTERHGFETMHRWGLTDPVLAVLYAAHFAGNFRMLTKRRERPELDFWTLALGVFMFGLPPTLLMLDLDTPTINAFIVLGLGGSATWVLLMRNRMPSVDILRRRDEEVGAP